MNEKKNEEKKNLANETSNEQKMMHTMCDEHDIMCHNTHRNEAAHAQHIEIKYP